MSFFGGGSSGSSSTFDKKKWAAKLTAEQKELLKLEIDTLHESWFAVLKDEILSKEFLELKRFLAREEKAGKKIFPPPEDVYSWYVFHFFLPFQDVRSPILTCSASPPTGLGTPPSTPSR